MVCLSAAAAIWLATGDLPRGACAGTCAVSCADSAWDWLLWGPLPPAATPSLGDLQHFCCLPTPGILPLF